MFYVPEFKVFVNAVEGTGDNLLPEDREEGYVDYVNITTYQWDGDEFVEDDGGMMMLTEPFEDEYGNDDFKLIADTMEFMFESSKYTYVIIEA